MIDISPAAIIEIKRLQSNRQTTGSSLILRVKSGGCAGLFYDLEFEQSALSISNDHNLSSKDGDRLLTISGINLKVDAKSWKYIENLKLDYSEDLMGGGFRFYNPRIISICGCGISFAELK